MSNKTALIFGSSGLVGSNIVAKLLNTVEYDRIKVFVRKPIKLIHPKLEQIITDFDHLEKVADQINGEDLFLCLGTTMAKAGSKESFYKVDFTYNVEVATIAKKNGVKQVLLISSMGADAKSWIYYSKVKGQVENAIAKMGFNIFAIIRPSLLLGDRQESRFGERLAMSLSKTFSGLFVGPLKKYKAIAAEDVAEAMIRIAQKYIPGKTIYESNRLEFISKN